MKIAKLCSAECVVNLRADRSFATIMAAARRGDARCRATPTVSERFRNRPMMARKLPVRNATVRNSIFCSFLLFMALLSCVIVSFLSRRYIMFILLFRNPCICYLYLKISSTEKVTIIAY